MTIERVSGKDVIAGDRLWLYDDVTIVIDKLEHQERCDGKKGRVAYFKPHIKRNPLPMTILDTQTISIVAREQNY